MITMEPRENTEVDKTIENFDYKAGFENLQDRLEEQRAEIRDLLRIREKQQEEIKYLMDKCEKYELVIKTVEALTGREIISEFDDI